LESAIAEKLPESGWDFGGYPYGLEPLTLPLRIAEATSGAHPHLSPERLVLSRQQLSTAYTSSEPNLLLPAETADRLYWFRWITGHQTAFILWQLLARTMQESTKSHHSLKDTLESARIFIRGYSAILLYTSSCPRDLYHRLIRPSMALQHPRFSGSWSRDYGPVRKCLRDRFHPDLVTPSADMFRWECKLNIRIHEGIAVRLVASGPSLLRNSTGRPCITNRDMQPVLFDIYFLTLRAPVSYELILVQLLRRLHAIKQDLMANELYSANEDKPAQLREVEVTRCERELPQLLLQIAEHALTLNGVSLVP
jgi:L-tyrosine peroxygenase